MTHQIKSTIKSGLTHRGIRLYSLFRKDINNRWVRISDCSYSEKLAYQVFTERMMVNPFQFSIRPIVIQSKEAR
jgi:hypothetical protein